MITLPFIGLITPIGCIVAVVTFIAGYFIGHSIKSGIKYAFVFVIFFVGLVVFGFIGTEVIGKLVEVVTALRPLYEHLVNAEALIGTLSLPIIAFVSGFAVGFIK